MKKILSIAFLLLCAANVNAATRSVTAFPTITPVTDDYFIFSDTSASGAFGRTTLANVKTALGVPVAADLLAGSCTGLPCLDGTSDGGDLIKLYGPGGFWTALQAGNSTANRSWRLPLAAAPSAGTTRLMNMDEYGQMGFVDPATFAAALTSDQNYVTDAQITLLGNTSGTNTGDQTSASSLTVTATGFDGNLATTDNTVQEIAQKFDDFAAGGGYTNLTSFIAQTANSVFYSDANGDVKEVALGANGTYFRSNGDGAAPTFDTPSGAAHDAITLGTDADILLGLSTQQVTLDSQTANYIFAAPNGSAGDPTFRALVDADIPDTITASNYLTTGGTAANSSQLEGHAASYFQTALTNPVVQANFGTGVYTFLGTPTTANFFTAITGEGAFASTLFGYADAATTFNGIKQAASESATGVIELATTAEVVTGADTGRGVTPAGVTAKMAAPGAIGGTTPAAGTFTTVSAATYQSTAADGSRRSILPTNTTISPLADGSEEIYNDNGAIKVVEANTEYDLLHSGDVDDTPSDGNTAQPASSNSVYDHSAAADPHTGYLRESALGSGTETMLASAPGAEGGPTTTIETGTSALGTSAISSGACASAVTTAATNAATTDVINWGFNGDPTGVTGYAPTANGMLTIIAYPSSGNVNFKVCNLTAASITPGAITLNWRIQR